MPLFNQYCKQQYIYIDKKKKKACSYEQAFLVTRARIELAIPPWKGGVLTSWPTGHNGSDKWIRTTDTAGMNRML